jgi:hypothetical protein
MKASGPDQADTTAESGPEVSAAAASGLESALRRPAGRGRGSVTINGAEMKLDVCVVGSVGRDIAAAAHQRGESGEHRQAGGHGEHHDQALVERS